MLVSDAHRSAFFTQQGTFQVKQKIIATTIGMALVISPLPALTADSASGPLQPGKAAGIQPAQGFGDTFTDADGVWVFTFVAALGVGIWVLTKKSDTAGGGGTTPTPTPSPATTTTTTTP